MNIFATDPCPVKCAEYLDDKRVVKMVLETAQILSSVLRMHGVEETGLYKSTHVNHPVVQWVAQSRDCYWWTVRHFNALCKEYTLRYGKFHKSQDLGPLFYRYMDCVPETRFTPPVNCARNRGLNLDYTSEECVYTAYKLYLNHRWQTDSREPRWSREAV